MARYADIQIHISARIYIYVCICMYRCTYVTVYVHVHTYRGIVIYVWIHGYRAISPRASSSSTDPEPKVWPRRPTAGRRFRPAGRRAARFTWKAVGWDRIIYIYTHIHVYELHMCVHNLYIYI